MFVNGLKIWRLSEKPRGKREEAFITHTSSFRQIDPFAIRIRILSSFFNQRGTG
jgi:hypothetical protein